MDIVANIVAWDSDLQISFENDGAFSEKDVGYPITISGEFDGEQVNRKPIGKITSVTGDTVYAVIFQEFANAYFALGKPEGNVSYSFSKEAWDALAERVKQRWENGC